MFEYLNILHRKIAMLHCVMFIVTCENLGKSTSIIDLKFAFRRLDFIRYVMDLKKRSLSLVGCGRPSHHRYKWCELAAGG
jgi:hypothetical protein